MKYICPICEKEGHISEKNPAYPISRTTCRNCGTILLINPDTGSVDAHKSPLRGTREYVFTDPEKPDAALPAAEMRPTKGSRNWTAIITVTLVVIIFITTGIYLILA